MLEDLKMELKVLKRTLFFCNLLVAILLIGWLLMFWEVVSLNAENNALRKANDLLISLQTTVEPSVEIPPVIEAEEQSQDVYFTVYHREDGSSTSVVGANTPDGKNRITTDYFEVNDKGFYTYNGKVVVATATHECIKSNYEGCNIYNKYEDGITYYNYHNEIDIEVDGVRYEAIVLDSCGKSHDKEYLKKNDEGLNRIDIFIADKKYSFGKAKGKVYVN